MNADQRPALIAGPDDDLPSSLRLVLPTGLDRDQTLRGLVQAIQDVRTRLAAHAKQFQRLAGESAASGCQLRQALYRGQALANADAASAIDKSIIGVFGLWDPWSRGRRRLGAARQLRRFAGPGHVAASSRPPWCPGRRRVGHP